MIRVETTAAQRAVWFTERAGVAAGAYQMAFGIWFDAELDERALGEACASVIERHQILSTAVSEEDGVPVLVPAAEKISLTAGALSNQAVRADLARGFDLDRGPLARFTLLAAGQRRRLLLVTAHHLVFDGVSKDVLAHDLAAAYRAAVAGEVADLGRPDPPPSEQPAAGLPAAREYWRDRWTAPADPVLPGARRDLRGAGPGGTVAVPLPPDVAGRIEAAARLLGVTRFELLLAAVHALLARYGNAGLPVSVALSTRTASTARDVGLFVNELPLALAHAGGTVREYVHTVRTGLRELYRHRAIPLAHAVGGLRPAAALTPISVSYRRQGGEPDFAGAATRVEWAMPVAAARNTLNVLIVDAPGEVRIELQHRLDALPADAAARIGGHLATLLDAMLTGPDRPVAALPLLMPAERDRILRRWNATERRMPPDTTVPALFAAAVRARPEAVALVDAERQLTYAELDAATRRAAAALRERGIGAGSMVAIALPRSWRAVVALLAVMRSGAAYVPIDPAYPAARRALILADAAPALVITATGAGDGHPHVALDDLDAAGAPDAAPVPGERDLAYVMYTSGSTGRPKGVAISHGALANLLIGMRDLLGGGPDDRWLALTSLSFDISGLELYAPLTTGARAVLAPDGIAPDGAAVNRLIREHAVTHVQATPSGWRILLDAGFDAPATVALTGGEALPLALARELRPRVARLFNVYGPTETTIWSTADELPAEVDDVTIGRPIANTRAYVLDGDGQPVPAGIPGELYLAGDGVAEGYLRAPRLTAERFLPDRFAGRGRLYRTGDTCAWLPDGRLSYIGRLDNQVKIRGHRIELGEIEARLLAHPAVAEAAVVVRGADTDARLAGYVVPRGAPPEPAELHQHLAETLPAAMVPQLWATLDRLPRTPNGKLDRAALPEPPRVAAPPAPPPGESDAVVAELTAIWEDVLQVDDIAPDEDLFDLGGHSLSITRISSRIQRRFAVEVPLDAFFDTPTVGQIAVLVRRALPAEGRS